ncbi:MAG: C45 family autoproteolytic acyltransferase/hydrolase, partial [Agathobacter rectalis]
PCIEGLQYWIVVRALLENCRNVQEALSYIKDMPIAFHMNMIIFDKEEHAALIQTYAGKKAIRCITTEKALLFTTNHAVLDDDKHLESGAFKHSVQRINISRELSNKTDITRNTLKEMLLSDYSEGLCFHHYRKVLVQPKV